MRGWSWVLFWAGLDLVWFGLAFLGLLVFFFSFCKSRFGERIVKADLTTMLHSLILSFNDGYCVPCFIN